VRRDQERRAGRVHRRDDEHEARVLERVAEQLGERGPVGGHGALRLDRNLDREHAAAVGRADAERPLLVARRGCGSWHLRTVFHGKLGRRDARHRRRRREQTHAHAGERSAREVDEPAALDPRRHERGLRDRIDARRHRSPVQRRRGGDLVGFRALELGRGQRRLLRRRHRLAAARRGGRRRSAAPLPPQTGHCDRRHDRRRLP
jgi:hypothetical protein